MPTTRTARRPAPTVDTRAYVRAHGRQPRGYGAWWFAAVDANNGDSIATLSVTNTYTRARVIARHQLDELTDGRAYDILVLS